MPNNAELARLACEMYPQEFGAAYLAVKNASFGDPTPEQLESIVNKVIVNHAGELYAAWQAGEGKAVNAAALPRGYAEHLARTGATTESITETVQAMYPGLSRADALAKWEKAAQRHAGSL